jgi:ADP-heptose:LPS heptosyltransferase
VYFRVKRVEQAWNRLFIRMLGRMMPPAPPADPDWTEGSWRVLYLRNDKIGDMIVSTSLIEAIARSHPTIRLDVLASPANAPILDGNPYIDNVIVWDRSKPGGYKKLYKKLRDMHYDAVIDCMVLAPSTTTLLLMMASGAPHRIGIGGRINDYALTLRVPPAKNAVHHIEHSAVLATAFGVDLEEIYWSPSLYFTDKELEQGDLAWPRKGRRLLVNISSGLSRDRWPDERYASVLQHIRKKCPDLGVIVISAARDTDRASRIAKSADVLYLRTKKLRDALSLVATSDYVLTPDTSIAHAASACGKAAVILYTIDKHLLWGRYKSPGYDVVSPDKTISAIQAEQVINAVDELLADCASVTAESK